MIEQVRQLIIKNLWAKYRHEAAHAQLIEATLKQKHIQHFILDHFAVIDLPGPHTGIAIMRDLFALIGYEVRGADYLPEKQNDFAWMAEANCEKKNPIDVLPQIVVADFRLEEMPGDIASIIYKYSQQAPAAPLKEAAKLVHENAGEKLAALLVNYFSGRTWPLPSLKEFYSVKEFNELLAWVLVFGRKPNHFTLAAHLLDGFADFETFLQFIECDLKLDLNLEGGRIKGGQMAGIRQASTLGERKITRVADGEVELPQHFMEFVWRYPVGYKINISKDTSQWGDFFTHFIAKQANNVIQSLYHSEETTALRQ